MNRVKQHVRLRFAVHVVIVIVFLIALSADEVSAFASMHAPARNSSVLSSALGEDAPQAQDHFDAIFVSIEYYLLFDIPRRLSRHSALFIMIMLSLWLVQRSKSSSWFHEAHALVTCPATSLIALSLGGHAPPLALGAR